MKIVDKNIISAIRYLYFKSLIDTSLQNVLVFIKTFYSKNIFKL